MTNKAQMHVGLWLIALLMSACSSGPLVKATADEEVRRLCAIDGGIKVYETVTLPAERFDQRGNIGVNVKTNADPNDEYFVDMERKIIQAGDPILIRVEARLIRRSDNKVLGISVRYGRGGGDLPGPWHPSNFDCPSISESTGKLQSSIFRKKDAQ